MVDNVGGDWMENPWRLVRVQVSGLVEVKVEVEVIADFRCGVGLVVSCEG